MGGADPLPKAAAPLEPQERWCGSFARVRALTNVVVYEVTQDRLASLLRDRPSMADELGALLARRSGSDAHRLETGLEMSGAVSPLTERIRRLFEF